MRKHVVQRVLCIDCSWATGGLLDLLIHMSINMCSAIRCFHHRVCNSTLSFKCFLPKKNLRKVPTVYHPFLTTGSSSKRGSFPTSFLWPSGGFGEGWLGTRAKEARAVSWAQRRSVCFFWGWKAVSRLGFAKEKGGCFFLLGPWQFFAFED